MKYVGNVQIFINEWSFVSSMGILNHLFGSTEAIAREMELDDKAIVWHWKEYLRTISRKEEIIGRLKVDTNFQRNLGELKKLLEIELVDISVEEKKEDAQS